MEDVAVGGAKLAVRVARRSIRPILIGFIINRTLQTLEDSRCTALRLAKLPLKDQMDARMEDLLGADWQQQMEADFLEAAKEVHDGYITGEVTMRGGRW